VSAFGAAGESVARFMHKGSRVAVDGRLEWREWENAEKEKRQAVSIVADTVVFLDSPEGSGDGDGELAGVGGAEGGDLVF
jgi:single-strand DNA-binding protein